MSSDLYTWRTLWIISIKYRVGSARFEEEEEEEDEELTPELDLSLNGQEEEEEEEQCNVCCRSLPSVSLVTVLVNKTPPPPRRSLLQQHQLSSSVNSSTIGQYLALKTAKSKIFSFSSSPSSPSSPSPASTFSTPTSCGTSSSSTTGFSSFSSSSNNSHSSSSRSSSLAKWKQSLHSTSFQLDPVVDEESELSTLSATLPPLPTTATEDHH
ncbi:hypothetical protein TYRP_006129 [Tyrophagus putrescentiae]|nr:hypothetical protein TYRP_006129 [Tyrophagus putrescentiae]